MQCSIGRSTISFEQIKKDLVNILISGVKDTLGSAWFLGYLGYRV